MLVLRSPESPPVAVRTLGDRNFNEIPPLELAEVMRGALLSMTHRDSKSLFKAVLVHYGLKRMTQHVHRELSRIFNELLYEDETSQLTGSAFGTSVEDSNSDTSQTVSLKKRGAYQITILGDSYSAASLGDTLIMVLGQLSDMDSEFLPRLSLIRGRTRRHVAQLPEDIYPGRPDLAVRCREIRPGWYVGDNYSRRDVERILSDACEVAGITYGEDLILQWPG